jgi:hypothetical protein
VKEFFTGMVAFEVKHGFSNDKDKRVQAFLRSVFKDSITQIFHYACEMGLPQAGA